LPNYYFPIADKITKRRSKSEKANLKFPVSRVLANLKNSSVSKRVQDKAAVYLAAVLEYLSVEILSASHVIAMAKKKKR
jgi:histone H2A